MQETVDDWNLFNTIDICIIKATLLAQLAKKHKYTIFAVTIADIKKALALKKYTDPTTKVPVCYYEDLVVFSQKETNKLVEHQLYDHKIVLEKGK